MDKGIQDYHEQHAIPAGNCARCVLFAMSQPTAIDINEIQLRPTAGEL